MEAGGFVPLNALQSMRLTHPAVLIGHKHLVQSNGSRIALDRDCCIFKLTYFP